MTASYAGLIIAIGIALTFLLLFRRLPTSGSIGESDTRWLSGFSASKYRPMERLLATSEFEFLRRQPGYLPAIEKKLRSERRRIFRCYLRAIRDDFHRLYRIASFMVVYGQREQSDLLPVLRRLRWSFRLAYFRVQLRLALHVLAGAQIDVRPLLQALEAMRAELQPSRAAA